MTFLVLTSAAFTLGEVWIGAAAESDAGLGLNVGSLKYLGRIERRMGA